MKIRILRKHFKKELDFTCNCRHWFRNRLDKDDKKFYDKYKYNYNFMMYYVYHIDYIDNDVIEFKKLQQEKLWKHT